MGLLYWVLGRRTPFWVVFVKRRLFWVVAGEKEMQST